MRAEADGNFNRQVNQSFADWSIPRIRPKTADRHSFKLLDPRPYEKRVY